MDEQNHSMVSGRRRNFVYIFVLPLVMGGIIFVLYHFLRAEQGKQTTLRVGSAKEMLKVAERRVEQVRFELKEYPVELDPPVLDPWGQRLDYRKVGEGFELRSAGPDLKFNTADDITP